MSEEVTTAPQAVETAPPVETTPAPVAAAEAAPTATPDAPAPEAPAPVPAYKKPPPSHVPYSRMQEVVEQKNAAQRELEQLRATLAAQQAAPAPAAKVPESEGKPDFLDPRYDTLEKYEAALIEWNQKHASKGIEETVAKQIEAREQARAEEEHQRAVVGGFQAKVQEAAKADPEIVDAVRYLSQFDRHIHPQVQERILTHEHAPQLAKAIAADEAFLARVINDPIGALMEFGRFAPPSAPVVVPSTQAVAASIPAKIKGSTGSGASVYEAKSMSEYRALRMQQGKR